MHTKREKERHIRAMESQGESVWSALQQK